MEPFILEPDPSRGAPLVPVLSRVRELLFPSADGTGEPARTLGISNDASARFPLVLDPEARAGEAARAIHLHLLENMLLTWEGVIQDLDPEFLHDFRVAIRRTRSAMGQIKDVFPAAAVRRFRREFDWLGERTGPARDMDVYLLKIPLYRTALHAEATDDLDPLVRFLRKKKRIVHGHLVRSLTSKRFFRLADDWMRFLEVPAGAGPEPCGAQRRARDLASERIRKIHRKILKRGRKLDRKTSPEALHRLRIDCKKLRYLMTFFHSLFPPDLLVPLVKEVKKLQDTLGEVNDAHVQRTALLTIAGEMMEQGTVPPPTLIAMGRLMGRLEAQHHAERQRARDAFQRFGRRRNEGRFSELFGEEGGAGQSPR